MFSSRILNPGFNLFGVEIKYYGVIIGFAMLIAVFICIINCKKREIKTDDVVSIALWIIPFSIIGARLFYVLFNPNGYKYSFVEALKIWEGGMSIWGGIIAGVITLAVWCAVKKKSFAAFGDVIAPSLIIAQAIGRWGNFVNQEAYGSQITNPAFQFFPLAVEINGQFFMATFFYECVLNLLGFAVIMILLHKTKNIGVPTAVYLMWYGAVRTFIECFRTDPMLIFGVVKFSQLMSVLSFIAGLALLIYILVINKKKKHINDNEIKPKKDNVVGGEKNV